MQILNEIVSKVTALSDDELMKLRRQLKKKKLKEK